jgi:hypothetical protein
MTAARLATVLLLALPFGVRPDSSCEKKPTPVAGEADAFAATVRPVLQARCAPCHEAGGKMYEKLPFDRAETIASHREGVLKRLKGTDREPVEKWLASLPPPK